jgi:hypothetical protein
MEDEEVQMRTKNMKVDPNSGIVYSRWDREERKRIASIVKEDDEVNEDEEEIKALDEGTLVNRINDSEERIKDELTYYN